jgi:hypothetical protein
MMKKYLAIAFIFISFTYAMAQSDRITVENVIFYQENDNLVVTYDIKNAYPEESFEIELKFVSESKEVIIPKSVTGDIGNEIPGGDYKKITWSVLNDQSSFDGKYKAVVNIKSIANKTYAYLGGGPGKAFLSILMPGVGDYAVRKDSRKKYPYWLIPTTFYLTWAGSAINYGLYSLNYDNYLTATSQEDMDFYYDLANKQHKSAIKLARYGLTIWIVDVAWVFMKGARNNNIRTKYNLACHTKFNDNILMTYDPVINGFQLRYAINF